MTTESHSSATQPPPSQRPPMSNEARHSAVANANLSRLARGVLSQLAKLRGGQILLVLPNGSHVTLGTPSDDGLEATVTVHQERFFREVALGGSLGAAEAYLQQLWDVDDLVALIRIFCRNLDQPTATEGLIARLAMTGMRLLHWMSRNTRRGSRRNIAAHYDLSNEFFQLFLDPTMMYSSGLFTNIRNDRHQSHHSRSFDLGLPEDPARLVAELEAASLQKIDQALHHLGVQAGDRLIEIGTGWGALAERAAREYGCHVTTTTISRQQYDFARNRIEQAGLSNRVTLLFEDYRDLPAKGDQYDHLISIEMIEAVGHHFLPTYFSTCSKLLKPQGRMLIQAITMPDSRYESYCRSVDYIQKYIFPGGHLPSVSAMKDAASQTDCLSYRISQEFPLSYARTLRSWRRRFLDKLPEVRSLGFDERFLRMWDYYLCYCEGAFLEGAVGVGQFVWQKGER
ncbi:MAG: cyclopropane-fatty-acyl-phospholipid synthase family protein [Planctomycetaceae bacterium]